jgi:hypothetical protein
MVLLWYRLRIEDAGLGPGEARVELAPVAAAPAGPPPAVIGDTA